MPAISLELGDTGKVCKTRGMAWLVPCAHGTHTIRLWSFKVRVKNLQRLHDEAAGYYTRLLRRLSWRHAAIYAAFPG